MTLPPERIAALATSLTNADLLALEMVRRNVFGDSVMHISLETVNNLVLMGLLSLEGRAHLTETGIAVLKEITDG